MTDDEPADQDYWPGMVGQYSSDLWWPEPTQAEMKRWAKEIRDRDRRRIPPGFRAPTPETRGDLPPGT